MARRQGPFDWQGRLESQGSVTFGPSRVVSGVLFAVAIGALVGFLVEIVVDERTVISRVFRLRDEVSG